MIKKLISTFIIFSLSAFNILGYTYDYLVISYDSNSTSKLTKIISLSQNDKETIATIKENYSFSDGSFTSISLKGLSIQKHKLDFKTNYKGIILNSEKNKETANYKEDLAPKRVYFLTSSISKLKNIKEKYVDNSLLSTIIFNEIKSTETDKYQIVLSNEPDLINSARGPPEFYIFKPDIKC